MRRFLCKATVARANAVQTWFATNAPNLEVNFLAWPHSLNGTLPATHYFSSGLLPDDRFNSFLAWSTGKLNLTVIPWDDLDQNVLETLRTGLLQIEPT